MRKMGTTRDVLGREYEETHTAQYGSTLAMLICWQRVRYRYGDIFHVIFVSKPLMIRNESIHNSAMLLKNLYSIAPLLVGEKYEML